MKLLYLLFLLNTSLLFSQLHVNKDRDTLNYINYFKEAKIAKKYFKEKKYGKAYEKFAELYAIYGKEVSIIDGTYPLYLQSAELSNQCYSRFLGVKFLIERCGYDKAPLIYKKHDLHQIYLKSGIDKEYISILRKRYLNSIDLNLRKLIIKMNKRDQLYRRGNSEYILRKRDSIDKLNEKALINIFEKKGYPNSIKIGNYWVDENHVQIFALLIHAEDSIKYNYFLPKLMEFIKKGETTPDFYRVLNKKLK